MRKIAIIAHVDHGKTSLTAAIIRVLAEQKLEEEVFVAGKPSKDRPTS
jgi:translation elongation factor EF-Tu-like GTPase